MKVKDFLDVLCLQIPYVVTDRFLRIQLNPHDCRDKEIYLVTQKKDSNTLNIFVY